MLASGEIPAHRVVLQRLCLFLCFLSSGGIQEIVSIQPNHSIILEFIYSGTVTSSRSLAGAYEIIETANARWRAGQPSSLTNIDPENIAPIYQFAKVKSSACLYGLFTSGKCQINHAVVKKIRC